MEILCSSLQRLTRRRTGNKMKTRSILRGRWTPPKMQQCFLLCASCVCVAFGFLYFTGVLVNRVSVHPSAISLASVGGLLTWCGWPCSTGYHGTSMRCALPHTHSRAGHVWVLGPLCFHPDTRPAELPGRKATNWAEEVLTGRSKAMEKEDKLRNTL